MNKHLEAILNFIQQSKDLNADAKESILKSVRFAEGELEQKNRELEIEAGLERVRNRAMAMLNSSDLSATASTAFVELRKLGIHPIRTGVTLLKTDSTDGMFYAGTGNKGVEELRLIGLLDMTAHPVLQMQYEAWLKQENYFPELNEEEQDSYYTALLSHPVEPIKIEEIPRGGYGYYFPFKEGLFYTWAQTPFSGDEIDIVGRFKCIFDLTFRRYLDLQKAEARTREARIEAALERVRAKAMSMHSSEDLAETLAVFYRELKSLSIIPRRCGVALVDKETRRAELTTMNTTEQGDSIEIIGHIKMTGHPVLDDIYENWLIQKEYHTVLRGDQISEYYQVLKAQIPYPDYLHDVVQYGYYFMFNEGDVYAWTNKELTEDELTIYRKFTTVISLTYKRYKELQQAEAQARESKIDAALERVRSKAMSMQKSDDFNASVAVIFDELDKLNIGILRCGIGILSKEKRSADVWSTTVAEKGHIVQVSGDESMDIHPLLQGDFGAWLKQEDYSYVLQGEDLSSYYSAMMNTNIRLPESQIMVEHEKELKQYYYASPFQSGMVFAFREAEFTKEEKGVMKRFAGVFNLTYNRFLDIQKAEAQARESQIEAALERVRSKALAMQKGEDLAGAVAVVFDELEKLNLGMIRCGIGILSRERRTADVWTTGISETGKKVQVSGDESLDIHPLLQGAYEAWLKQQDFSYVLEGEDFVHYYQALENTNFHLSVAHTFVEQGLVQPMKQYYFVAPFESGTLFAFRENEFPEEGKKIIQRFADVFNLTYTRFLDLQKAEAQAKEAQLERKRSEDLLLNILPQEIANELMQFGKSYARKHKEVTIMFADIKGFSSIAEILSPDELVTQLDECFRAFDKIVEKHGLEKIKTVGDAYVCACGLPKPVVDHAAKTVAAALDMIEFTKGFGMTKIIQNLPAFEFRVGIHTGPVVTGVVGLKKYTYDIWGDAVNMAARMEQHGEAGKINVSGDTYQLIKDKYSCTHRGKIPAKNKGEVDMYFVTRNLNEG